MKPADPRQESRHRWVQGIPRSVATSWSCRSRKGRAGRSTVHGRSATKHRQRPPANRIAWSGLAVQRTPITLLPVAYRAHPALTKSAPSAPIRSRRKVRAQSSRNTRPAICRRLIYRQINISTTQGSRKALMAPQAGTVSPSQSTAAATPPRPCGMPSARSATSMTPSVPSIIGALTCPMCAIRNA